MLILLLTLFLMMFTHIINIVDNENWAFKVAGGEREEGRGWGGKSQLESTEHAEHKT